MEGDWQEAKCRWKTLAVEVQRVLNDLRALWLAEHYRRGSHLAVRRWMQADVAWARTPKAERGKRTPCPVKCWDGEISKHLWRMLAELHPELNSRVLTLAINIESKTLASSPACKSAYPRWMKTLCGEEGIANNSQPQPIAFDTKNGGLIAPNGKDEGWKFWLRIDRTPPSNGSKTGKSTLDTLYLRTGGRKLKGIRKVLEKIAAGEWVFKGSKLAPRDGKWYLLLAYRLPKAERPALDPARVAYLSPACDRPMTLWLDGFPHWLRRKGMDVCSVRRQLLSQRWSRQENYRFASSAQKGHGRQKVFGKLQALRRRWRDAVKTYNERLAADVIRVCIDRGFGALVYYQPEGWRAERRFLSRAGKVEGGHDSSQWDWFQLKTLLERRCEEAGVEFSTRKVGGTAGGRRSYGRPGVESPESEG